MGLGSGGSEISTSRRRVGFPSGVWIVAITALLVELYAAPGYGYFRDELYYLACAKRLAWGYVDQPPLSIALLRAWTLLFGTSLLAIRTPVALAFCAAILLNAKLAQRLSPSAHQAPFFAALTTAVAPVYMVTGHLFAMNGLDVVLTAALIYCWELTSDDPRWWLALGGVFGIELLNKWSVLWIVAGILFAVAVTPRRKAFMSWHLWAGLVLGLMIASPSLVWQYEQYWPTLEFIRNARQNKMLAVPGLQFVLTQLVVMNLFAAPIWIAGIASSLRDPRSRNLAITFLFVAALLLIAGKSRPNYLSPAYCLVIPPGAIAIALWFEGKPILLRAYTALLGVSGTFSAILVLPLLPLPVLSHLVDQLPQPPADEAGPKSKLQGHADTLGWPELARATLDELNKLPPNRREHTFVLASNYGEAAALEFYGIPRVICPHNNYWIWGTGNWDGNDAVLVGSNPNFDRWFKEVGSGENRSTRGGTPEEASVVPHRASKLKTTVPEFWVAVLRFE